MNDMKNFIHNAGHELKTPISVIDSNLQLIDDLKTYDKEMNLEMRNEIKRLNSLLDSLIKLSDIKNFTKTEKINLKSIITEIINEFKLKTDKKNIKINLDISKNININTKQDYLYMFLSNII
jgi:signal transduction histidine kinase